MKFMNDDALMYAGDAIYEAWVQVQSKRIGSPTRQQLAREFCYWRDSMKARAWDDGAQNGCMCSPPEIKNPWRKNIETWDKEYSNKVTD
jgi:hypothetical protein